MTRDRGRVSPAVVAPALLGALLGLSAFPDGLYDSRLWVPLGLVVLLLAAGLAVLRPVGMGLPTRVALGAVAGLGCWQLLSTLWGASPHSAFAEGDRTLVLAGVLGLAVLLARDRRGTVALLAGLAAGIAVVGLVTVVRLEAGDDGLFSFGRLDEPVGYINAQAAVLAMGAWLTFGFAAGAKPLRAAAATGTATALAALVVLAQSRGAILASVVAATAVIALARERRARLVHLVVVVAAVAVASPVLLDVYSRGPDPARLRWATLAVVLAGTISGVVWGIAVQAVARASPGLLQRGERLLTGGVAVLIVAGVLAMALNASTFADQVSAFTDVGAQPTLSGNDVSRLASGSGNRLDYWRIALDAGRDHPLGGVGAGSYPVPYLRDRRTDEVVVQPHSIELQALAETGPVGLLLLLVALGAVGVGVLRLARRPVDGGSPPPDAIRVGAVGAATAYLAHTSVDWMHLIPGVAGMAMVLAAALLTWDREPASAGWGRRGTALPVAVAVVSTIGVLSLARQGLTERDVRHAQATVATEPATALSAADSALRLDGQDLDALYARAGALTRLGRPVPAEAALRRAARIEPDTFTTWLLLGDAAVRRGDLHAALLAYGRALQRNPRDRESAQLFRRIAVRLSRR